MSCCPSYQIPFTNTAFTTIHYNADMVANLGTVPKISLWYWDEDTQEFYETSGGVGVAVSFDGSTINIDHGGIAVAGFVKLS